MRITGVEKLNLKEAMRITTNYLNWGDPNADFGSFEPVKGEFKKNEDLWEITCKYTRKKNIKKAKVIIDNNSWDIIGFELLEG